MGDVKGVDKHLGTKPKFLPETPASPSRVPGFEYQLCFPFQFPANMRPRRQLVIHSSSLIPATYRGDLNEFLAPTLAVGGI